ncbi:MAG: hypothetical protein J6M93_07510 [Succinivibrio sp.]|nr:hypothetical protein [Succinivibrio sp.]
MLNLLLCTCLALAVLCILMLFMAVHKFSLQKAASDEVMALCALLPYARAVNNRTIILKDGSLCTVIRLKPQDLSCLTAGQQEFLQKRLADFAAGLPSGFCIHFDVVCRNALGSAFKESGNMVLDYFEKQRRELFSRDPALERDYFVTITWQGDLKTRLAAISCCTDFPHETDENRLEEIFLKEIRPLETALSQIYELMPLCAQDNFHPALSHIKECLTGRLTPVHHRTEENLDSLLATDDFYSGYCPVIGSNHIAVVTINSMPGELTPNILNDLAKLRLRLRVSQRFIAYDSAKSELKLRHTRRLWQQKTHGILSQIFNLEGGVQNENALRQVDDLDDALCNLEGHENIFGAFSFNVILMAEDRQELEDNAALVCKTIEKAGFGARIETINSTEAFLGSLPGNLYPNLRQPMISSAMLSCFIPFEAVYTGEKYSPNKLYGDKADPLMQIKTISGESFDFNLHQHDLGNTLIFGPPGSGKSVLLGALMLNLQRYRGMRVFAFDRGYSFYALTMALRGTHLNLDDESLSFAPLQFLDNEEQVASAADYIETLCRLNGLEVVPLLRQEITGALTKLRDLKNRTLSDLHLLVSDRSLKQVLATYLCSEGSPGLLDGSSNPPLDSPLTVFECAEFFSKDERTTVPVLKQLFNLIGRALTGAPAAIILDEAWMMLKNRFFAEELLSWFKTLRKHNAFVIMATQSLSDSVSSGLYLNLLDCAKTRLFLPNADAGSELERQLYLEAGLDEKQIEQIENGRPKQDYYLLRSGHFNGLNLELSEEELLLLGKCTRGAVEEISRLKATFGEEFFMHLKPKKGVTTECFL